MEINDIVKLIEVVSKNDLTSFEYKSENEVLILKKKKEIQQMVVTSAPMSQEANEIIQATSTSTVTNAVSVESGQMVISPLVGTFYSAVSPDAEPFVKVGDQVKKGQVLGIVEAMKLMNEIESDYDGVVKEVLIKNEEVVEYGQPLFRIG